MIKAITRAINALTMIFTIGYAWLLWEDYGQQWIDRLTYQGNYTSASVTTYIPGAFQVEYMVFVILLGSLFISIREGHHKMVAVATMGFLLAAVYHYSFW